MKNQQPPYIISPTEDLVIDIRTISRLEYAEEKSMPLKLRSERCMRIDGRHYPIPHRHAYELLRHAMLRWHQWFLDEADLIVKGEKPDVTTT